MSKQLYFDVVNKPPWWGYYITIKKYNKSPWLCRAEGKIKMTIIIKKELDFNDLMNECWSGALYTLEEINGANLEDDLMALINELFTEPSITEINDFLWFDSDYIYETLGIESEE